MKKVFCGNGIFSFKRAERLIIFLLGFLGLVYIYFKDPLDPSLIFCPVFHYTGVYCAGCGSTRAIYQLLHGNFFGALRYNPLMIISIPLLIYLIAEPELNRKFGWRLPRVFTTAFRVYIAIAMLLLYTILRNIAVFPFTMLAPPV